MTAAEHLCQRSRMRSGSVRGPRTWPADHVTASGSVSSKSG